jgi:hypothetical protein
MKTMETSASNSNSNALAASASVELQKIIWILWLQGFASAPELVKKCVSSWQRHNPNWKVIFLDDTNYKEYIDIDDIIALNRDTISPQAWSNIIRINLLTKYGGVWADSTCYCINSLDSWIPPYMATGFFAFERPAEERLLSSWFMASTKGCHLTETYCRQVNDFWRTYRFPHQKKPGGKRAVKLIGKLLNNRTAWLASLWVHPLTVKLFKLHPYHWFHYLFYRLVHTDEKCGRLWSQTPKYSADVPHRLLPAGLLNPLTPEIKAAIDSRKDPFYKLTWRRAEEMKPGCILDYLLNSNHPANTAISTAAQT